MKSLSGRGKLCWRRERGGACWRLVIECRTISQRRMEAAIAAGLVVRACHLLGELDTFEIHIESPRNQVVASCWEPLKDGPPNNYGRRMP